MGLIAVYSENFESYAIGHSLLTEGWVHYPFGGDVASFLVKTGKYGECKVTAGAWGGGFLYEGTGSTSWTDYIVEFDVPSYVDRIIFGFRLKGTIADEGYYLQCRPGVANESIVKKAKLDYPTGDANLDVQTAPSPVTKIKIELEGQNIKIYYNNSAIPTHDFNNALYSAGTIGLGCLTSGWVVNNIVVGNIMTEISNVAVSGVLTTSASISWDTDLPADSLVEYGVTPSYGSFSLLQPTLVLSHSVLLSSLTPGCTYFYRVISTNTYGTAVSIGYYFSTPTAPLQENKYIKLLKALLPLGKAWSRTGGAMPDLLNGISQELNRVDLRAASLFNERDSRYADSLLPEHEADLNILAVSGATNEARRIAIRSILTAVGGADPQYFIDLAANMGYTITVEQFRPAWCGVVTAGESCGRQDVIFVWRVNLVYDFNYIDPAGADLLARLQALKPAHTELIFRIVGVDFSNAFSTLDFNAVPIKTGGDFNNRDFLLADFFVNHAGDFERIDFDKDDFKLYR